MVTYPISVSRSSYRGNQPAKRAKATAENRIAAALEQHVNALLQNQERPIQQYTYQQIATEMGIPIEDVRRLGFSIDGGSNGFTAYKAGMGMQEALDVAAKG